MFYFVIGVVYVLSLAYFRVKNKSVGRFTSMAKLQQQSAKVIIDISQSEYRYHSTLHFI